MQRGLITIYSPLLRFGFWFCSRCARPRWSSPDDDRRKPCHYTAYIYIYREMYVSDRTLTYYNGTTHGFGETHSTVNLDEKWVWLGFHFLASSSVCVLAGDVLMLRLRWSVAAAAVIVRRYYSVVMIAIWRSRAVSSAVHYYGDVEND